MHEYIGTVIDFRGLFKINKASAADDNLPQIICNTAKENFEKSGAEIYLFRLVYTADEHMAETWRKTECTNVSRRFCDN